MHPVDPTASGQLRNLPGRQNVILSHPAQQKAPGRRCHSSVPTSTAPDINDCSYDSWLLTAHRKPQTHQRMPFNAF